MKVFCGVGAAAGALIAAGTRQNATAQAAAAAHLEYRMMEIS
jgi:hypothetical protein